MPPEVVNLRAEVMTDMHEDPARNIFERSCVVVFIHQTSLKETLLGPMKNRLSNIPVKDDYSDLFSSHLVYQMFVKNGLFDVSRLHEEITSLVTRFELLAKHEGRILFVLLGIGDFSSHQLKVLNDVPSIYSRSYIANQLSALKRLVKMPILFTGFGEVAVRFAGNPPSPLRHGWLADSADYLIQIQSEFAAQQVFIRDCLSPASLEDIFIRNVSGRMELVEKLPFLRERVPMLSNIVNAVLRALFSARIRELPN